MHKFSKLMSFKHELKKYFKQKKRKNKLKNILIFKSQPILFSLSELIN